MHALVCRCSSGYNLAKYPQDMQVVGGVHLRTLNTQVAEQCNSILDRVRTQVKAFHHHCVYILCEPLLAHAHVPYWMLQLISVARLLL